MTDHPAFTTLMDAANILQVPYYALYEKVKRGTYPSVKFHDRYYVCPDLLALLINSSQREADEVRNISETKDSVVSCGTDTVSITNFANHNVMNFVNAADSDKIVQLIKKGATLTNCLLTINDQNYIGYTDNRRI